MTGWRAAMINLDEVVSHRRTSADTSIVISRLTAEIDMKMLNELVVSVVEVVDNILL
ncbi:hypothetical protein KIN20_016395 [Parelaphostrongylus tenuis]|uniref:Uncharacterized protein n=1 Tax=Parelaphostrongylus tenuis TaxID=148309 RepID=A0AAD5MHC2_PARTN|nr:hypothetical protein KIN20_016395 [Parelaphostrongylus tenuis]